MAVWRAGRANVGDWQAHLKNAADEFEPFKWHEPVTIFPNVQIVGEAPRRVQEAFDATLASQRQELTAGMKSAYGFFAHRLPTSVAILVGLQDG